MDIVWIAALSGGGALALGLPLRFYGWRTTWNAVRLAWRTLRGYRWWILLILLAGAVFGLWRFDDVRDLIFGLF